MPVSVRVAGGWDLPALREIERAAGQRYRDFGLDQVADDEPASIEVLSTYAGEGRAWVVLEDDDVPVGYILLDEVEGAAHIEQVSVLPEHRGRGLGRALIDSAAQWAASRGMTALTLTTFGHIPWNRPLYEHLGFRVLGDEEIGPGLLAVRHSEATQGLDPAVRVVMRRELDAGSGSQGSDRVQVRLAREDEVRTTGRQTGGDDRGYAGGPGDPPELEHTLMYRDMAPEIEQVYLMSDLARASVRATLVRELAASGSRHCRSRA